MSKVDLRLQCGMPCSKLEVSTVQHGTLSGTGYLHQSRVESMHPTVAVIASLRTCLVMEQIPFGTSCRQDTAGALGA